MLSPKYDVDTMAQYCVTAHFNCNTLCALVTLTFHLFPKIGSHDRELVLNIYAVPTLKFKTFAFLNYAAIICRFVALLLSNRRCQINQLVLHYTAVGGGG